MPEISVAEIARLAGGRVVGEAETRIGGVAPLEIAGPGDLAFVANPRYLPYLQGTRAGAVLIPPSLAEEGPEELTRVVVDDPHVALYRVLPAIFPPAPPPAGVHPTAVVDPTATVGEGASIGPFAVIGAGCRIGARSRIGAHVVVGE